MIALLTTFDERAKVLRIDVSPNPENGLKRDSKVMVDKLYAIQAHRIHQHIGKLDVSAMNAIDRALMLLLDLDPLRRSRNFEAG